MSYVQFAELMGLFAAPLNSSHQFVVHVMDPVAGVLPHCAAADFGIAEKRTPNTNRRATFVTVRRVTGFTSAEMKSRPEIKTHSRFSAAQTLFLVHSVCQCCVSCSLLQ
jgi:hypothetical protein